MPVNRRSSVRILFLQMLAVSFRLCLVRHAFETRGHFLHRKIRNFSRNSSDSITFALYTADGRCLEVFRVLQETGLRSVLRDLRSSVFHRQVCVRRSREGLVVHAYVAVGFRNALSGSRGSNAAKCRGAALRVLRLQSLERVDCAHSLRHALTGHRVSDSIGTACQCDERGCFDDLVGLVLALDALLELLCVLETTNERTRLREHVLRDCCTNRSRSFLRAELVRDCWTLHGVDLVDQTVHRALCDVVCNVSA